MEIMNAQIERIRLGLFDPIGQAGLNFLLKLDLILANKGCCTVELNPRRIPELLDLFETRHFNNIEGKYIQVKVEGNKRQDFIRPILSNKEEDWIELDNGTYFGSQVE